MSAGRRVTSIVCAAALVVAWAVPVAGANAAADSTGGAVKSGVGANAGGGRAAADAGRARRGIGAPEVQQMVVFRNGRALTSRVAARSVRVEVGGRRCAVPRATPLAALVRSRPGPLRLRDYGSCSSSPRDAAGLFVRGIRGELNRGRDGWVYKVGRRAGSAGAADPAGPFGAGRLRSGARLTWFYCRMGNDGCQRTLTVSATPEPGAVLARVNGYDDQGRGEPIEGATVHVGAASATTGADGSARVTAAPGGVRVWAQKDGLVRSFEERVTVP